MFYFDETMSKFKELISDINIQNKIYIFADETICEHFILLYQSVSQNLIIFNITVSKWHSFKMCYMKYMENN